MHEGLTTILRWMIGEMEVQTKKAELLVFPLLRKGGGAVLAERIDACPPTMTTTRSTLRQSTG